MRRFHFAPLPLPGVTSVHNGREEAQAIMVGPGPWSGLGTPWRFEAPRHRGYSPLSVTTTQGSVAFRGSYAGLGDMSSAQRIELLQKGGLDKVIAALPGNTLTAKLANGYAEAKTRLSKYTSTLRFDPAVSSQVLADIRAWQERNADIISEYMKKPETDTLPEQVAYKLGPTKAQQLVIAGFSEATRGMGPWMSGVVASTYTVDPRLTESFVTNDASYRLSIFASIIKMDDDGDLFKIFRPDEYAKLHPATSGLGFLPAIVEAIGPAWTVALLVLTVVGTVAAIAIFVESMTKLVLNNQLMTTLCQEAQKNGQTAVVQECVRMAHEGQASIWEGLFGDMFGGAVKLAVVGGLVYLAATHVVPELVKSHRKAAP